MTEQKLHAKSHWARYSANLRRAAVPIAIGAVLTVGTLWTQYGMVTERNSTFVDVLKTAETKLLDIRFRLRGPFKPQSKVGVLAVDEKSVRTIGRWPFPRSIYEKAFQNLKAAGVAWVGMDITWSEPERTLLEDVLPEGGRGIGAADVQRIQAARGQASPGDQSLARGLKSFGNVVLGYFYYPSPAAAGAGGPAPFEGLEPMESSAIQNLILPEGKDLSAYPMINAYGIAPNIPMVNVASSYHGFFNNDPDDDGVIRWINLVRNIKGRLMPSLALKTVASAMGREPVVFFDGHGIEEIVLMNPNDDQDLVKIPVDPVGTGRAMINHLGGRQMVPHFSFVDAMNNSFTPEEREQLQGAVLLAGPTATGINDIRANSFDATIDGVENHAAFIDNVFTGKFMRRPSAIFKMEFLGIIVLGLLTTTFVSILPATASAVATTVLFLALFLVDRYFWFGRGVWVAAAAPLFTVGSVYLLVTTYRYLTEEREKKKVKGAFSLYLSSDVIAQVLENPESLKLGGEKKELTVFFSDVRDFTTMSESMSPEKLCELMNLYFTPMTKIVLDSKGVLDKFIGDAIMAFWGAPLEVPNTADVACEASINMLYVLDRLRVDFPKMGLPVVDIGIGLNTGPMSVGNMGSEERFTYTVMGDNVNLGSRLEGLTKEYGVKILLSDRTFKKISRTDFHLRDLDTIRVKGKLEPVRVHELMRPDAFGMGKESLLREFTGHFNEARGHYLKRDWANAQKSFMQCMLIRPEDKPCGILCRADCRVERHES
ncbi:MAG: adenylate/guanylate cyclase domain-containing protein [Proteobacteria bacterium]|nr:adenylate/guanylate cyclase domain-containing protein [Pseudomonadota bacterium]